MRARIVGAVALGVLLGACVPTRPLTQIAVDSNRLVAETADQQTLINILRAKDRMPMHFTSFKVINGDLSISSTAGLDLGFAEDAVTRALDAAGAAAGSEVSEAATTASPSISASIASSPSFELAIYDNQEFQRGVLSPVRPSTIEYYLQNGWPQDMLTALFVEKVEVIYRSARGGAPARRSFQNEADSELFGAFINTVRMVPRAVPGTAVGLLLLDDLKANAGLSDLTLLDGDRYDVQAVTQADCDTGAVKGNCQPGMMVVRRGSPSQSISFEGIGALRNLPGMADLLPQADRALVSDVDCNAVAENPRGQTLMTCTVLSAGGAEIGKIEYEIYLRAPEGILYFLGSYARCDLQEERDCTPYLIGARTPGGEGTTKVIEIKEGTSARSLITARHRGQLYSIEGRDRSDPQRPNQRGSQAIVLVQQLINLQKSADALPVSSSLRLSN